jgi:hypothetical protein
MFDLSLNGIVWELRESGRPDNNIYLAMTRTASIRQMEKMETFNAIPLASGATAFKSVGAPQDIEPLYYFVPEHTDIQALVQEIMQAREKSLAGKKTYRWYSVHIRDERPKERLKLHPCVSHALEPYLCR